MTNGETLLLKILMYLPKVLFATIGGIISLIFSDDIKADGSVKIGYMVILKLTVSVALGLAIGDWTIFFYDLHHVPVMAVGLIFLMSSVFGLLALGILYRSVQLTLTNKTLAEVISEVKRAFLAVFGK